MGDFKMLAMVGAFLGWPLVGLTLIFACVLGIVIGGGALLVSRRGLATRIPFGTFIAVAALVCAYAEGPVLRLYEQAHHAYLVVGGPGVMTQFGYMLIGLTAIVAMLVGVMTFAVLRIVAGARDTQAPSCEGTVRTPCCCRPRCRRRSPN